MNVTLIDHMGSDLSVCNAARVSFDKTSEWEVKSFSTHEGFDAYELELSVRDTKLINYLAKHNHWTPFGHAFASFRIKAPIFVARQLGKHQVGLVWNEVSRRYVDNEPEFFVPEKWRKKADNVKQGSSDEEVVLDDPDFFGYWYDYANKVYKNLLNAGVCPEQARMVLPQSLYTEWIWSGSLAAFARVCKLRLDPHTQYETRLVAEQIDQHMAELFPVSWKALNAATD